MWGGAASCLGLAWALTRTAALWADADVRSEARLAVGSSTEPGAALQVDPRGDAAAAGANGGVTLSYDPQLLLGVGSEDVGLFHKLDLAGKVRLLRGWTLQANAFAGYGLLDVSPLAQPGSGTGPAPLLEPLPANTVLEALDFLGDARSRFELSRLLHGELEALGEIRGGANDLSRAQLPLERTARFDGSLSDQWTRTQTLTGTVTNEEDTLSIGARAAITEGSATWSWAFDEASSLAIEGGAGWVESEIGSAARERALPLAGATLTLPSGGRTELGPSTMVFRLRVAPYFDRITGQVYPWYEGRASYDLVATSTIDLAFSAGVAGPTGWPPDPRSLALLEIAATDRVSTHLHAGWGIRGLAGPTDSELVVFASLRFDAQTSPKPPELP